MTQLSKQSQLARRRRRIRSRLSGTDQRPRLAVTFSNRHIVAQLVDDTTGRSLAYITTAQQKLPANLSQRAEWAGSQIAKAAAKAKISRVVFDRRGKPYHGRLKVLAEAARAGGLEF